MKGKAKKTQKQTSVTKKNEQDISYEVETINTSNSQENIEINDIENEENVTLQKQAISPENNFTQSSTEKHTSHDTRANNSERSGNNYR